jgi:hypothetical protein
MYEGRGMKEFLICDFGYTVQYFYPRYEYLR